MAGLEGTKTDRQALTGDISVKPGIDGKSVTIVKITESTEDGGNNIVEFSDGSRLKIKNGSGGKIGIDGKSAYQYAQDGGYTGTEEEFALLMSQENLQTEKVDKISIEVSKLSEEIEDVKNVLDYSIEEHSNNMLIANDVINTPFSEVFTSSQEVLFPVGSNGDVWGSYTGQLCAIVIFTDNTVATSGVWYANDSDGNHVISGGINQAKVIHENFTNIKTVGFYFGSSARSEYADKTIKTIGLFTGVWTSESEWLDDYYVVYGSSTLKKHEERIDNLEKSNKFLNWYIEENYYIAKGLELNIYYDTICDTNCDVYFVVDTEANRSFCNTMDNCLRFNVNSEIGAYPCTIKAYERGSDVFISETSFTVNVIENTKPSKKIMFIGDSLTDQNYFVKQVRDNSDGNIMLYGTRGDEGYKHEGYAGWSPSTFRFQQSYNGIENAFYNADKSSDDKFDFAYYMQNNPQFADVEVVNIMLGRNGGYNNANLIKNLNAIITNIKYYNNNIKIYVCLPYFTPWSSEGYYSARKISACQINEQSFIGYSEMKKGISEILVPIGVNIDTTYDFPHLTRSVSERNTADTKMYYIDNVHPNIYGYQKMADIWYSELIGK